MRSFLLGIGLTVFALGPLGQDAAFGSFCGVARCCHCRCVPCCMQCCTVMKTCMVTEYTYQDMTAYKIVYEDVETPVNVPAVEYQPAPRVTCVPDTVLVPPKPCACQPASCPPTNACAPVPPPCLVPMNICRKVELPGVKPVNVEKPDVIKRVVERHVPYTVTLCIPHLVCKQVPVQVCCPVPCCCTCARRRRPLAKAAGSNGVSAVVGSALRPRRRRRGRPWPRPRRGCRRSCPWP